MIVFYMTLEKRVEHKFGLLIRQNILFIYYLFLKVNKYFTYGRRSLKVRWTTFELKHLTTWREKIKIKLRI